MLRSLRTLSLKNNNINWLSQYETENLEKLNTRISPQNLKLTLKGNPIVCNCESLHFIQWIYTTKVNVDLKETEKKFKLALHDRDFIPGKFIADNIIDIIKVSRKIVFVVSKSFLDSEWCQYELDMARMHMFQQNREMLIVILLDDIPNGKIPSRLKQIWEKITCLETDDKARNEQIPDGDDIFWKRLYLAIKP
ncbi:toll-like receptor 2 [Mytilus californianus]|uniref:toll-like receptor 2 n=1 Tax=Mytilus californianus TaxID=6549 RepID=UPI00224757D9|nr:toll-like receptor 2 [Mytilus californianus]